MPARERAAGSSGLKRWRASIFGLFGLTFGVSSSSAAIHSAANERAALETRVAAVRETIQQQDPQERAGRHFDCDLVAQWLNWPNWNNWGNWPNWPNWGNWFNR